LLPPFFATASATSTGPEVSRFAFSCAAFPQGLTEAALIGRYGREQVVDKPVVGSDDGPQDGTVLFSQMPDRRLEIVWQDVVSRSTPRWVKAVGTRWVAVDGISIGTSLRAVERLNGLPFRLAGFQTEASGVVWSWGGGRLGTRVDSGDCRIEVHFQPSYDGTAAAALLRQVRSGRDYSSGHPAIQGLNPPVAEIWLMYRGASHRDGTAERHSNQEPTSRLAHR
jgi:hypothetical protein